MRLLVITMMRYREENNITYGNGWCFALVNGRLAEIFFDRKFGIWGYCCVKRKEYNKREQRMIDADIKTE